SETARGNDVYALLQDGTLDRMSIGFEPIEHVVTEHDDGSVSIKRTRIRVREVSLVPFPAYDGAKVASVRHAQKETPTMPEADVLTRADLTEVNTALDELSRSVTLIQAGTDAGNPANTTQF